MRSQFANLRTLTLPGGATTGVRWVFDGVNGEIRGYDAQDRVVVFMSPERVSFGVEGDPDFPSRLVIDPLNGVRWYQTDPAGNTTLAATLAGGRGLELLDPEGRVTAALTQYGLTLSDYDNGTDIVLTTGALDDQVAEPHNATSTTLAPGTTCTTPAAVAFTADDLVLRYVSAFADAELGANSWTSPAGYTERLDTNTSSFGCSLSASMATDQPGTAAAVETFTATQGGWDVDNAHTIVVRSDPATPAAYRSHDSNLYTTSDQVMDLTFAKPGGLAVGDLMIGIVSFAHLHGGIPVSYTIPLGWRQLQIQIGITGDSTLASIVVYKVADADDVAGSGATAVIDTGTTLVKKVHTLVTAISTPYLIDAIADIMIGDRSMPRGVIASQFLTGNSIAYGDNATTDFVLADVEVSDRRLYAVNLHTQYVQNTTDNWLHEFMVDGVVAGQFHILNTAAGLNAQVSGRFLWLPTAGTKQLGVRVQEITPIVFGDSITYEATANAPRAFWVEDIGAR